MGNSPYASTRDRTADPRGPKRKAKGKARHINALEHALERQTITNKAQGQLALKDSDGKLPLPIVL